MKEIEQPLEEFQAQEEELYNVKENWTRESTALKVFNRLKNPNIVRGIGAYTQMSRYFIVMEWAERGDLTRIWKKNPNVHLDLNESLVAEFLEQFYGLANALSQMHQYPVAAMPGQSMSGIEATVPRYEYTRRLGSSENQRADARRELASW
jgi:serine/threonine protein kinase